MPTTADAHNESLIICKEIADCAVLTYVMHFDAHALGVDKIERYT